MNRTLKEATVRRYHYDSHEQLREHLPTFLAVYTFAKRLKTLRGLTPHEYICKCWTENPDQFRLDPFHHMPGLNSLAGEPDANREHEGAAVAIASLHQFELRGGPAVRAVARLRASASCRVSILRASAS